MPKSPKIPCQMRRFFLKREEDVHGVSGEGIVAEGVEFSRGMCVISWLTKHTSTTIFDNIFELEAIHGHDGRTKVVFVDDGPKK